ncbi:MAG: DNA adenine methylase [bacterium]|nr:DNA adenine methylase [bacterium]
MQSQNKPFETYPGGKASPGTKETIINLIPPHDSYIELFLGGGAIFRNIKRAPYTIGLDLNPEVIVAWERVSPPGVRILQKCGVECLEKILKKQDLPHLVKLYQKTFIYADPPYPMSSRSTTKRIYGEYEWTDQQHLRFLDAARYVKCNMAISTYPNEMYRRELRGWHLVEFQGNSRGGITTEWLFLNYDPEKLTELHDSRYWGDGHRVRDNLKKQISRNIAKFRKMPVLKREAILKALNQEFGSEPGENTAVPAPPGRNDVAPATVETPGHSGIAGPPR